MAEMGRETLQSALDAEIAMQSWRIREDALRTHCSAPSFIRLTKLWREAPPRQILKLVQLEPEAYMTQQQLLYLLLLLLIGNSAVS